MSLYENKTYTVKIGNISLTDGSKQAIYHVVNKKTEVIEEQLPQMVVAFGAADELDTALTEFWESKEDANVSPLNLVH
jgi:hypothetical protein